MAETHAQVTQRRRVARIWIVPIVAVLLGLWMVIYTWRNEGPEITITFSTAEGIESGKTKIKARSVDVGVVQKVTLGDDLESVVVTGKLDRNATPLLREDTQFWVVRPRIGAEGITGLGTVLSGGYLELAPGTGEPGRRDFAGLDDPPVTPTGTPGLHVTLVSDLAGSVSTGNSIHYRGFEVGRIESTHFDVEAKQVEYGAFIDAPYDDLVTTRTRFWNVSGISFSADADGIKLSTGSLESLLLGGIAFGLPENITPGSPVEEGATFELFDDLDEINEHPYHYSAEYVVEFARSVRGLRPGAPVEYRGLRAGYVERILLQELVARNQAEGRGGEGSPIPVLIVLEPGRLQMGDSPDGVAILEQTLKASVRNGLRATLSTGSLLTGSLYIALDMYPDEPSAQIGTFASHPTLPTIAGGLEAIEQQVTKLLDKLNALPLDDVAQSADDTLVELKRTITELRVLVASEDFQTLPNSLDSSLQELDRTLRSINELAESLEAQPNALIFPRSHETDPEPPAGSP